MLIVMFTHNMYNTFKISVQFTPPLNKKIKWFTANADHTLYKAINNLLNQYNIELYFKQPQNGAPKCIACQVTIL